MERTVEEIIEMATRSGRECWQVFYLDENGDRHSHTFPKDTLSWRAAEYGIDPADVDTLLDIVLHEPHVEHVEPGAPQMAARGFVGKATGVDTSLTIMTADTVDDAREAHLARIAAVKERVTIGGPQVVARGFAAAPDPFGLIRQAYQPDHEAVAEMRAQVEAARRRHRGEPLKET